MFSGDIRLFDEDGRLVAEARGLHLRHATREALRARTRRVGHDWLYDVRWLADALASARRRRRSRLPLRRRGWRCLQRRARRRRASRPHRRARPPRPRGTCATRSTSSGWSAAPGEHASRPPTSPPASASSPAPSPPVRPPARDAGRRRGARPIERRLGGRRARSPPAERPRCRRRDGCRDPVRRRRGRARRALRRPARRRPRAATPIRSSCCSPAARSDGAERIYRDSPVGPCRQHARRRRRRRGRRGPLPPTGRSRVLEIGGGDGGHHVVGAAGAAGRAGVLVHRRLAGCSPPAPRTASPMPVDAAAARSTSSATRAAQGIPLGPFDVVVAANVLHATADLRALVGQRAPRCWRRAALLVLVEGAAAEPLGRRHVRPDRGLVALRRPRSAPVAPAARA